MTQLKTLWTRFRNEECGATMVEYGLIVALVAVAAIAGVTLVGGDVLAEFNSISTSLQANN